MSGGVFGRVSGEIGKCCHEGTAIAKSDLEPETCCFGCVWCKAVRSQVSMDEIWGEIFNKIPTYLFDNQANTNGEQGNAPAAMKNVPAYLTALFSDAKFMI